MIIRNQTDETYRYRGRNVAPGEVAFDESAPCTVVAELVRLRLENPAKAVGVTQEVFDLMIQCPQFLTDPTQFLPPDPLPPPPAQDPPPPLQNQEETNATLQGVEITPQQTFAPDPYEAPDDVPPSPGQPGTRSTDEDQERTTGGDPVNLFTGEFSLEKVDFELPSRGVPFVFRRCYKSGTTFSGPFGFNWDHNYNIFLRHLTSGALAVNTGCLHEDIYSDSGDSVTFLPPRGVFAIIERVGGAGGVDYVLSFRGGLQWVFGRPSGWSNPERIPVIEIRDASGNTQMLAYSQDGRLAQVIDTVGRRISLIYGQCGLLEALRPEFLQSPGQPPVEVRYLHAATVEHLAGVVSFPTADFPEGLITCYEYDEESGIPALAHNIVRVVDSKGQTVVENQYGTDASDDTFNRVVRQYFMGSEYLFRYRILRPGVRLDEYVNDAYQQTEVYEPSRPLKVLTFNFRGNLLDERFRLCADGSYRLWARAYRYNKHGQLTELYHPNGMATFYAFDEDNADPLARGNLLTTVLKSQPNRLTSRVIRQLTYEPVFQRIKTDRDGAGQVTIFVYDYEVDPLTQRGNVVQVIHPDAVLPDNSTQTNCVTVLRYNQFGQPIEKTSPEGRKQTFEYHVSGNGAGQLQKVIFHEEVSRLSQEMDYDPLGNITKRRDDAGHETRCVYDLLNQLIEIQLPAINGESAVYKFEYDADRRLAKEYIPRGAFGDGVVSGPWIVNEYFYDVASWLAKERRYSNTASPQEVVYRRDVFGSVTQLINPLKQEFTYAYDERGLLLKETRFATSAHPLETTYRYDLMGNPVVIHAPDGTAMQYDFSEPFGRLRSVTDRLGLTRAFQYDARNQTTDLTVTDSSGTPQYAKAYKYDAKGRLVSVGSNGLTSQIFHDRDDLRVRFVDHSGAEHETTYDGIGRFKQVTGPTGEVNRVTYDAAGNMVSKALEFPSASSGALVSLQSQFAYDERNRPVAVTDPLGNGVTTVYDERNLGIAVVNSVGVRANVYYNAMGHAVRSSIGVGAQERTINRWQRDMLGRLEAFEDAEGHRTEYRYDDRNNIATIVNPDLTVHTRRFDPANYLASETDPNGTVTQFTYDGRRQLSSVSFASQAPVVPTPAVTYAYDAFGRIARATKGAAQLVRGYDAFNRVTGEIQNGAKVTKAFDDQNRTTTLVYPDGREDLYRFDQLGRIQSLTLKKVGTANLLAPAFPAGTKLAEYDYDGAFLVAKRYANGLETRFEYGPSGLLSRMELRGPGGNLLDVEWYFYDGERRKRLILRNIAFNANKFYEYDELGRLRRTDAGFPTPVIPANLNDQTAIDTFVALVDTSGATSTETYQLTDSHRRVSWTEGGISSTATSGSLLELTSVVRSDGTSVDYGYDANGNRLSDGRFTFQYDALDQLVKVERISDGQTVLEHDYDGIGRVIRCVESGVPIALYYDSLRCIQETEPSGAVTQYAFGGALDELLVRSASDATHFYHQNPLLTLCGVSDRLGSILQWFDFSSFGTPSVRDASGTALGLDKALVKPLFAGRPLLTAIDAYDNRKRQYDYKTGVFFQRDPLGCADGGHQYLYAHHDPVDKRDALGLMGYTHSPYIPMNEDEKQNVSKLVGDTAFGLANAFTGGAPARIAAQENLGTWEGLENSGLIGVTTLFNIATFGFHDAIQGGISDTQQELMDLHFKTFEETAGDNLAAGIGYRVVGTVAGAAIGAAKHIVTFIPLAELNFLLSDSASTAAKWEAGFYGLSKMANLAALGAGVTGRDPVLTGENGTVGYGLSGQVGTKGPMSILKGHGTVTIFESFFDKNGNGIIRWLSEKPAEYRVPEMNPNFYGGKFTYAEHTVPIRAADKAFGAAVGRWTRTNMKGGEEPFRYARNNCSHFASETLAQAGIQILATVPKIAYWNFKQFPFLGGTLLKTSLTSAAMDITEEKK